MKIIKIIFKRNSENWVDIEFEDGSLGAGSVADGVRREHTLAIKKFLVDGGVIEEYIVPIKTHEEITSLRYARLENIFNKQMLGLKRMAINKPNLTNKEAIENQYNLYEQMYFSAQNGYYDATKNEEIIYANETTKKTLAPITLLLNTVKSIIETKIAENAINVDALLDKSDALNLVRQEITPTLIVSLQAEFLGGA